jgi:NADPH:quinone reductase
VAGAAQVLASRSYDVFGGNIGDGVTYRVTEKGMKVYAKAAPRAAEAREVTIPNRIEAALALAGGDALDRCLDLVRAGGRVAYPNGVEPEPRRRRCIGLLAYDAVAGPREFARLDTAVDEDRLQAPIAGVYPLVQAAKAHVRLENGHVLGRIVLRIRR